MTRETRSAKFARSREIEKTRRDENKHYFPYSDSTFELNSKDQFGMTAFMWACFDGHTDVVQLLLDNSNQGLELNARDRLGQTAFMWACLRGHKYVVEILLNHNDRLDFVKHTDLYIDLNARNTEGETAYALACFNKRKEVVQLLLEHSKTKYIDTNIPEITSFSALSKRLNERCF